MIAEKAMAHHSSTLAWKIPWTEEPGGLQFTGSLRVGHDWVTSLSLSCIGEGNGNPLQCSCLENPRDGGTWWAAVYGVVQRRTQLKQLSSSSSSIPTPSPHPVCRKIIFHKTSLWCQKSWGLLIHSFTGRNKSKFLLFGIHSLANTTSSTK